MAWPFRCISPDFIVRSVDDTAFGVKRRCLTDGSELFNSMFADCADQDQTMDLPETADTLSILFRLLHEPPPVFQRVKPTPAKASTEDPLREAPDMSTVIPLPLIPIALNLADKYCLSLEAITALHSHIGAHVTTEPLKVYGMAISLGLDELASEASEYLLHPPLSAWRTDEIKVIPTVEALHQLVRLHAAREVELRRYLQGETVFPHGYEACRSHGTSTIAAWEERKQMLMPRIRAGTDVASEMAGMKTGVEKCEHCTKRVKAALEMLAYKCRRAIRKTSQLPQE